MTNATDKVNGPSASRKLDGLKISIDLKTLDTAANKFASLLPASLTSQLPVAIPNDQQLTLDLATVQVSSTASPAFAAGNSGNSGDRLGVGAGALDLVGRHGSPASPATRDRGPCAGTSGGGRPREFRRRDGHRPPRRARARVSPAPTASAPTSTVAPAFKGIGAALILLGLLAASALAYAYKRADDASELLGTSCADGDPLMERFTATPDDLSDFGGPGS